MHLKILTYNWHEPYLCLLSRIGHTFLVIEPEISNGAFRRWDVNMRPIPDNVILVSEKEAIAQLDEGALDLVIAHNIKDLIKIYPYSLPKILVFHNKLTTEINLGNNQTNRNDYLDSINPLLTNVKKVFISESKRQDWDMKGDVILPGLDINDYGGYSGDNPSVLRVGNLIKERDLMMGFTTSESILSGFPSITLGLNPNIPTSRMSRGFDDLLNQYRSSRVYLHTTSNNYEDGYNLALLEAMAVGMPIISINNKTSPIEDGINGYKSDDIQNLRTCLKKLLEDQELAKSLGQNGRETVNEKFPQKKFLNLWEKSIEKAIVHFIKQTQDDSSKEVRTPNLQPDNKSLPKYFKNIREDVVSLVPEDANDILEIGCAAGRTGMQLKVNSNVYVAGVELNKAAADEAKKVLDDVIEGDIENIDLPFKEKSFDCILFADVLEHLIDPLSVLNKTKKLLRSNGSVVASIPNVQYLGLINHLIDGNWTYQDEGILDRTHLRFFTFNEILKLFDEAGFVISSITETLDPQYDNVNKETTSLTIGRMSIKDLSPVELKKFFVFQYKISAKIKNTNLVEKINLGNKENIMNGAIQRGKSLENDGSYHEAINTYIKVESNHADYAEVMARIGNCHMQMHDLMKAEKYYKKSLEIKPNGYVASIGLGLLEVQTKKVDHAIKRFSETIKKYPGCDKALSGIGIAYMEKNEVFHAIEAFSQALKINIESKPAMSNLLKLSYEIDEYEQIEIAMKRLLENHPDNTDILFGLAGILYKTNRLEESINKLSLLLEFKPNHDDARILLGKIEQKRAKFVDQLTG